MIDLHTMQNIFVCAMHFDSDDIIDTQTYLYIDGQTKTRSIKATLKKGAVPKYLLVALIVLMITLLNIQGLIETKRNVIYRSKNVKLCQIFKFVC